MTKIATLVFRLIMTTITLRHSTSSTGNLPRSAVVRAQTVVQFVKNIYRDHGEIVARPLWRLLQNLIAQVRLNFFPSIYSKMWFLGEIHFLSFLSLKNHFDQCLKGKIIEAFFNVLSNVSKKKEICCDLKCFKNKD